MLSFHSHINHLTQTWHYQFQRTKAIQGSNLTTIATQLMHAFVLSCLDYCNNTSLGPTYTRLNHFQSVMNVLPHLIFGCHWNGHVMSLHNKLHWLHVNKCIIIKHKVMSVCQLSLKCLPWLYLLTYLLSPISPIIVIPNSAPTVMSCPLQPRLSNSAIDQLLTAIRFYRMQYQTMLRRWALLSHSSKV